MKTDRQTYWTMPREFRDGFDAAVEGKDNDTNPNERGSDASKFWDDGWHEGYWRRPETKRR